MNQQQAGARMRMLIVVMLLLVSTASTHAAFAPDGIDEYKQQLREYDQRVAQGQQWEAEQQWKRWVPFLIIFGVLVVYLAYSQIAARRRFNAVMLHSQQSLDQTIRHNQEMIDLLKSINERLGRGG